MAAIPFLQFPKQKFLWKLIFHHSPGSEAWPDLIICCRTRVIGSFTSPTFHGNVIKEVGYGVRPPDLAVSYLIWPVLPICNLKNADFQTLLYLQRFYIKNSGLWHPRECSLWGWNRIPLRCLAHSDCWPKNTTAIILFMWTSQHSSCSRIPK